MASSPSFNSGAPERESGPLKGKKSRIKHSIPPVLLFPIFPARSGIFFKQTLHLKKKTKFLLGISRYSTYVKEQSCNYSVKKESIYPFRLTTWFPQILPTQGDHKNMFLFLFYFLMTRKQLYTDSHYNQKLSDANWWAHPPKILPSCIPLNFPTAICSTTSVDMSQNPRR